MTSIWKRSLSMFLAFIMVFGMVPVNAFAMEEEIVEEVLVEEEVFEEEIVEEEILDEEPVEEEPFEEENAEEEPVVVEVEEFHAADDVANVEQPAEGYIWVNKAKMEDEIIDILSEDGKIKELILEGVFGWNNYDDTYTVEYACTITLPDETTKDIVMDTADEDFADVCGVALYNEVDASEDNSAIFLVNGVETKIIFMDSRYVASIVFDDYRVIENKGALTQAQVEEEIKKLIYVDGESPVDGGMIEAVLGTDYTVEFNYLDENGNDTFFSWPEATKEKDIEVVVTVTNDLVFDLDNAVTAKAYFVMDDTRELYTVTYQTYFAHNSEDDEVKVFEDIVEGSKTPVFTPAPKEWYELEAWYPAVSETVDQDQDYYAEWVPKAGFDADNNLVADQEDEYEVTFYDVDEDDNEYEVAYYNGKLWGTPFADLVPTMEREGYNFAGWTNARGKLVELPEKVGPNGKNMYWEFYARWTEDYVVTFISPLTGADDHYVAVKNNNESTVAQPTKKWDGVVVTGWTLNGQPYDFSTPVTGNLTLEPVFFVDVNNNGKEDGTAEDPFYTYIWTVDGKEVSRVVVLSGQSYEEYVYVDAEGDKVTFDEEYGDYGWVETVDGTTTTYATVLAADTNSNNVADRKETVNVIVEGEGTVTIDGTKVNGTYVYDSTKSVNTVKAAPKMAGEYTETYVASIERDGSAATLSFSNYAASVALIGAKEVKVVFAEAGFDVVDGELATHAGAYNYEEVYNAVVQAPAFIDGTTVEFLARAAETIEVDISFVKDIVYKKTTDAATREMFDELYNEKTNNGIYNLSYEAVWADVTEVLDAEYTLDACIDEWTKWMEQDDVSLIDVKNELNNMLADLKTTNIHPFGKRTDGKETVKISYQDKIQNITAEADVTLVETRIQTSIKVANKLEVTYGQNLTVANLLNGAYVVDEYGNKLSATITVKDAADFAKKDAGTYTVTLIVDDFDNYIGTTKTYDLVVKKASAGIVLEDQTIVPDGGDFNITPNTKAEFVQIIAGIDIDSAKIDLESGVTTELVAKAWIKLPQGIMDLIEEAKNNPELGFNVDLTDKRYPLKDLQKMLTEDYAAAFEIAGVNTSMIDDVVAKMDMLRGLMERAGIKDEPLVDVVFVDSAADSQGPDKIGMYINMCVVTDSNYEQEMSSGMLLIYPGVGLPNNGGINEGLQLTYNGKAENLFEAAANGKPVALTPLFEGGKVDVTVQYFGIDNHATPLLGKTAPTKAGVYMASAVYNVNGEVYSDAVVIIVAAKDATIAVSGETVEANGATYAPTVTATEGAAYTLISAEANVDKNTVTVNIDMPEKAKDLLDTLLEKVGYKLPTDVTVKQLLDNLNKVPAKIESMIPVDTLAQMGVPTDKIDIVLNKLEGYVAALSAKLEEVMDKVGVEAKVSFENGKTYSDAGFYFFAAIVTDPDYLPAYDTGYLVIENSKFKANDETVPLATAKDGYMLVPTDTANRGYLTIIKSGEGLNLLLDSDTEKAIIAKIEDKLNVKLDGGKISIEKLAAKGDNWADKVAESVVEIIREKAEAKINGNNLIVKIRDIALNVMEKGLEKVKDTIVEKVLSAVEPYGKKVLAINGDLPCEVGKYEFHFFSYSVAYESAVLEIADDLFKIHGANVKLGDTLDMYFYVKKADLKSRTDYYTVITRTYADGREDEVVTIPYEEWEDYNSSLMRFGYFGMAAKEMTDELYITVYNADGTPASEHRVDSMQMYADRQLNPADGSKPAPKLQRTIVDMMNYGTEAQDEFDYSLNDLANAMLGEHAAFASGDVEAKDYRVKGENYVGSTIVTKSRLIMTFYFKNITRDSTAYISYTDHYGNKETLVVSGSEYFQRGENLFGVDVTGMAIADGRCLVTCEVRDVDGTVIASASDSMESYAARNPNVVTAYKLLQFADSACAYFEK